MELSPFLAFIGFAMGDTFTATNYVSILVLLDAAPRPARRSRNMGSRSRFQSLFSWMLLIGNRSLAVSPACLPGFNPCSSWMLLIVARDGARGFGRPWGASRSPVPNRVAHSRRANRRPAPRPTRPDRLQRPSRLGWRHRGHSCDARRDGSSSPATRALTFPRAFPGER